MNETYGEMSVVGDSQTFKNHDLIVGIEKNGKISFLGHGAYSKGFYSVTFDSSDSLRSFVKQKRKNFSEKQYKWLDWIITNHLSPKTHYALRAEYDSTVESPRSSRAVKT